MNIKAYRKFYFYVGKKTKWRMSIKFLFHWYLTKFVKKDFNLQWKSTMLIFLLPKKSIFQWKDFLSKLYSNAKFENAFDDETFNIQSMFCDHVSKIEDFPCISNGGSLTMNVLFTARFNRDTDPFISSLKYSEGGINFTKNTIKKSHLVLH